jgi:hypothetical protein
VGEGVGEATDELNVIQASSILGAEFLLSEALDINKDEDAS